LESDDEAGEATSMPPQTRFPLLYLPDSLALGDKPRFISATDADTPTVELPIRMLGMDAPELHYGGAGESNPGKYDSAMQAFLAKQGKELDVGLKAYLKPRLKSKPCTRHIAAGAAAFAFYEQMVAERLKRVSPRTGRELTPRRLFVMVAPEVFDHYGRMLAYVNARYESAERKRIPAADRPTFNLQMMREGHASSLLIFPNVPKQSDLAQVRDALKTARQKKRGFWKSSPPLLHAFEFRWIIDMIRGRRKGPSRFCGDITTAALYPPQQYYKVPPENRLWFFPDDVGHAYEMGFTLHV
jgi:endonuclease YncB( thermonuclease family)